MPTGGAGAGSSAWGGAFEAAAALSWHSAESRAIIRRKSSENEHGSHNGLMLYCDSCQSYILFCRDMPSLFDQSALILFAFNASRHPNAQRSATHPT